MIRNPLAPWSVPRRFVAGTAGVLAAVAWSHGLAAVLRHLDPSGAPPAALALTVCAALSATAGAIALPRRGLPVAICAGVVTAVATAVAMPVGATIPWATLAAVPLASGLATAFAGWLGRQLPGAIDGVLARRRILAGAWALLAVVAVVQTGRLATAITDPEHPFVLTTQNPFWAGHECLPAYLHGAELALRGDEDIYAAEHYPALDAAAEPVTALAMRVDDPYQYPPPFLLLPATALALSGDYPTLRVIWFALQLTLFAGVFAALARWVGGSAGRSALWLLPAVLTAFPVAFNFQFGQFHLAAVALAVAAMLCFAGGRRAGGGLLLSVAILAKMFPAVLLVALVAQRRFREAAWTLGWGAALTVVALAVFGPAPFVAFADHLPRLSDGSAFAFDEAWPEVTELVIFDNQGAFGMARKLGAGKPLAAMVSRLFTVALLAAAAWAGWRFRGASRWARGALWLALLGLGSLASPGAWGDYVPSVAVWLLALVAVRAAADRRLAAAFGVAAGFQVFLIGSLPLGDWSPATVFIPLSAIGAAILIALFAGVVVSRPESWSTGGALASGGTGAAVRRAA